MALQDKDPYDFLFSDQQQQGDPYDFLDRPVRTGPAPATSVSFGPLRPVAVAKDDYLSAMYGRRAKKQPQAAPIENTWGGVPQLPGNVAREPQPVGQHPLAAFGMGVVKGVPQFGAKLVEGAGALLDPSRHLRSGTLDEYAEVGRENVERMDSPMGRVSEALRETGEQGQEYFAPETPGEARWQTATELGLSLAGGAGTVRAGLRLPSLARAAGSGSTAVRTAANMAAGAPATLGFAGLQAAEGGDPMDALKEAALYDLIFSGAAEKITRGLRGVEDAKLTSATPNMADTFSARRGARERVLETMENRPTAGFDRLADTEKAANDPMRTIARDFDAGLSEGAETVVAREARRQGRLNKPQSSISQAIDEFDEARRAAVRKTEGLGEKGSIGTETALHLGAGAVGAAAGAALDDESPVKGAVVGGLTGLATPTVARTLARKKSVGLPEINLKEAPPADLGKRTFRGTKKNAAITVGPAKDVEPTDYLRTDKLTLPDNLRAELNERVKQVGPDVRGAPKTVEPIAAIRARAKEVFKAKEHELADIDPRRMNSEEGMATMAMIEERTKKIADVRASIGKATLDSDRGKLERDLEALEFDRLALIKNMVVARTEKGRALNALKYVAHMETDPAYWLRRAEKMTEGVRPLADEERLQITRMVDEGRRAELVNYVDGLYKPTFLEQLSAIRKAGFLASIPGRGRDFLSNASSLLLEHGPNAVFRTAHDKVMASALGARSTGVRTATLTDINTLRALRKGLGEGAGMFGEDMGGKHLGAMIKAMAKGDTKRANAARAAWAEFMRNAPVDEKSLRKLDASRVINIQLPGLGGKDSAVNRFIDTYQKATFRFTQANDRIINRAAFQGTLYDLAKAKALTEKAKDVAKRTQEILAKPDADMLDMAATIADAVTFQNNSGLAANLAKIKAGITNPNARAAVDLFIPFVRTPANILSKTVEYTPIAYGVNLVRAWNKLGEAALREANAAPELLKVQRQMAEHLGRGATGTGLTALAVTLHKAGLLSGATPEDKAKRDQWAAEGKQANSLQLGDKWIPIAMLAPGGSVLAAWGSVLDEWGEEGSLVGEVAKGSLGGVKSFLDQPFVTGTKQVLETLTDPDRSAARFGRDFVASFVPVQVAALARATDGTSKEPNDVFEAVAARIPFLTGYATDKVDAFGEPLKGRTGFFNAAFNPLGWTTDKTGNSRVLKEMRDIGFTIARPQKEKDETSSEYNARLKREGGPILTNINTVLDHPGYKAIDERLTPEVLGRVRKAKPELAKMTDDELRKRFKVDALKHVIQSTRRGVPDEPLDNVPEPR